MINYGERLPVKGMVSIRTNRTRETSKSV